MIQPDVLGGNIWDVAKGRKGRRVLRSCNLACRGGESRSVARARGSCGIPDTMGGAFEWIPDEETRVAVGL